MNKKTSLCAIGATLLIALFQTGCVGYRLGSMLPDDVKTVFIPTIVNKSNEPLIESELTQSIIEKVQLDGSLKIVPEDEADAVLSVVLKSYNLEPVAFQRDNRSAANQYRINLVSSMVLRRTRDQSVVAEGASITGQAVFDVAGDLTSSKRVGNPLACDDLANRIVQRVVEYW
jgi:PBP1b-binding outer membrane lipoprotein LpoB